METIIASFIFLIVLVASFAMYQYLFRIGAESRYLSDVNNVEQSAFEVIESIVRLDGWENFYNNFVLGHENEEFALSLVDGKYKLVAADNNGNNQVPYTDQGRVLSWKFEFKNDDTHLGPYLKKIKNDPAGTYTFEFSQPITTTAASGQLDEILPVTTNPAHSWTPESAYITGSNESIPPFTQTQSVTIKASNATTVVPGDRINPSTDIFFTNSDGGRLSDITYAKGVLIPQAQGISTGYPQAFRVCVTTAVQETDVDRRTCQYIRYQE